MTPGRSLLTRSASSGGIGPAAFTTLTLSDNTQITFLGVSSASQLTVTPTFTAVAEVTKAAPAERRQANNQAALVIALVWILAVTMPAAELKLPPEAQQYLNGLYATIGLALIVTWRINDNRKH